ncbi:MAG: hypothetical protein JWO76_1672 [Nocardioides sp.]|nr:hypothetical protein [Nocardioides sp.]
MLRRALGFLAVATTLVLVLASCADGGATSTRPGSGSSGPGGATLDCRALIPDAALTALGCRPSGAAEEHAGCCERRVGDASAVTVNTRALTGGGADPAQQELDAQCGGLRVTRAHRPIVPPASHRAWGRMA